jgi:tRNA(Arg) A34 adenosine deaminase TadA
MDDIFQFLLKSVPRADKVGNSQHCAVVVHKGSILSVGHNKKKSHPLQKFFADKEEKIFIHAELDALTKIKDKNVLTECDLYVLRVTGGKNVSNSEPCVGCKRALKYFKIRNTYWTTDGHNNWLRS